MKLDKNTKHNLMVGDVLRFSDSEKYEVLRTISSSATRSNALNLTLRCPDGRVIYGTPSSHYYGAEIISRSAIPTFKDFCKARGILDDAQDIAFCVADYLYEMRKDIEKFEPYATTTIAEYREAERVVAFDLLNYEPHKPE